MEGGAFDNTREEHLNDLVSLELLRIGSGFRDAQALSLISNN